MNKHWWLIIAGLTIGIAVIFGLKFWPTATQARTVTRPDEAPVVVETEAVSPIFPEIAADPASAQEPLPELSESDPFVRGLLADWSLPKLWKAREDLVRRFVVVLDNAARGELPKRQLAFLAPQGRFQVIDKGNRLIIDPQSYRRYDTYLDLLEALPVESAKRISSLIRPLIVEALAELGTRDPNPEDLLSDAIAQIEAIPEIPGEVVVVQPKVFYQFANPGLEALSPLQKQVLRMGPKNVLRLKRYLRALL